MADCDFTEIDSAIYFADYKKASTVLNEKQNYYYSKNKDKVLINFDQGIVNHFAKEYEVSNNFLSTAEKEIEDNFTKSVTQKIGQAFINDNVAEYVGEVYEDIYTNIFMCLNYVHLGLIDDAMVEIRRFNNKLQTIGLKYSGVVENQKRLLETDYNYYDKSLKDKINFYNSAFARYMSMLLYRTDNDYYNAKIDYDKIIESFQMQKSIYNFEIPSCVHEELNYNKDFARINIISFTGFAPIKYEEVLRIPFSDTYYKLALPVLQKSYDSVNKIIVEAINLDTKQVYKTSLQRLESIENIVTDVYSQHYSAIYTRSLIRSISKSVNTSVLNKMSRETEDSGMSLMFGVLSLFSRVSTEVSERADVRCSRYLPANVNVAGLTVPEGKYKITLNYLDKNNRVLYTYSNLEFEASANKLNLVESVFQNVK